MQRRNRKRAYPLKSCGHRGLCSCRAFAPRAVDPHGQDGRLASRLLALDIPDCGCQRPPKVCGCTEPCDCVICTCEGWCDCKLRAEFWPPCAHILAAAAEFEREQEADPYLTPLAWCEEWEEMLHEYDRDGYADPPLASPPDAPIKSKEARLSRYLTRAWLGYALHHPFDSLLKDDGRAVVAARLQSVPGTRTNEVGVRTLAAHMEREELIEEEERAQQDGLLDRLARCATEGVAPPPVGLWAALAPPLAVSPPSSRRTA